MLLLRLVLLLLRLVLISLLFVVLLLLFVLLLLLTCNSYDDCLWLVLLLLAIPYGCLLILCYDGTIVCDTVILFSTYCLLVFLLILLLLVLFIFLLILLLVFLYFYYLLGVYIINLLYGLIVYIDCYSSYYSY